MKKKGVQSLKVLCYVALTFCALYLIAIFIECPSYFYANDSGAYVRWNVDQAWVRGLIAIGYASLAFVAVMLSAWFFANILRGIRGGDIFPRRNVGILYALAVVLFPFSVFSKNLTVALSAAPHGSVEITDASILLPLAVLIFAQMYKIAQQAVEDSNLTV